jgi:putative membrane protein
MILKKYNMKNSQILISAMIATILLSACGAGAGSDAKATADSANKANIDSAKLRDTSAAKPVHMADLKQDAEFVVAAADGGMLEVALGKLAVKKATSSAVKKFASQMVADHTKANLELKALSVQKHLVIPDTMSDKYQKILVDLGEKNGKDFNKDYADLMVKDHKETIDLFKKEATDGNDAQINVWAKNTLPTLEHHLMMAEEVQKAVDK